MPQTLSDYAWIIDILYELLEDEKISACEWLNLADDMPYFDQSAENNNQIFKE